MAVKCKDTQWNIPIERYINNLIFEVPPPPQGMVRVKYTMPGSGLNLPVTLQRPPPNRLPLVDIDFRYVFKLLDPPTIIALAVALWTEQRVVLCCSKWSLLTRVAHVMNALLFPMTWQGVFMPLLPEALVDFMYAPVPFIAGIHSSYLERMDRPHDVVFVNLDKNEIHVPTLGTLPEFPDHDYQKLLKYLTKNANLYREAFLRHREAVSLLQAQGKALDDPEVSHLVPGYGIHDPFIQQCDFAFPTPKASPAPKPLLETPEVELVLPTYEETPLDQDGIRRAFMRFIIKVTKGFRLYCPGEPMDEDEDDSLGSSSKSDKDKESEGEKGEFNMKAFLEECSPGTRPLLAAMSEAQMFEVFVQHCSDGVDRDYIRLFDEEVIVKENRSLRAKIRTTPFIESKLMETVQDLSALAPNKDGLSVLGFAKKFQYQAFPAFDAKLFGPVREVAPLIKMQTKVKVFLDPKNDSDKLRVKMTEVGGAMSTKFAPLKNIFGGLKVQAQAQAEPQSLGVKWVPPSELGEAKASRPSMFFHPAEDEESDHSPHPPKDSDSQSSEPQASETPVSPTPGSVRGSVKDRWKPEEAPITKPASDFPLASGKISTRKALDMFSAAERSAAASSPLPSSPASLFLLD